GGTVLYLALPSFLRLPSGTILLFGVSPDGNEFLPAEIGRRVRSHLYTRRILADVDDGLPAFLHSLGMQEIPAVLWLKRPRTENARDVISRFDRMLDKVQSGGDSEELIVLNPEQPVQNYKRRWTKPSKLTGRYIARRNQSYGAQLWAYVELSHGNLVRTYDILPNEWRACDRAWQLQLAIDYERARPQIFSARKEEGDKAIVSFYSPLPRWIRMRWDILAEPYEERSSLFSYLISAAEFEQESEILVENVWLARAPDAREGSS
ncbi:MAG: hypothetical protein M3Y27_16335, partial [Acidobacteriota bacterium]|nr:hypothetical protein [Acidobacteriota bacterium]